MTGLQQTGDDVQNASPDELPTATSPLPAYQFVPVENHNRVDYTTGVNLPLYFPRLEAVTNPLGATTTVTYTTQAGGGTCGDPTTTLTLPAYRDNNGQNCYEQPATTSTGANGTGWFNKYLVTEVDVSPGAGGGAVQTTLYSYFNTPGSYYDNKKLWRYDNSPTQLMGATSYDEYVGYPEVWTTEGVNTQGRATTLTQHLFFRGLQDDPNMTGHGNPTSDMIDTNGISTIDRIYLAGEEAETRSFSGTISSPSEISDTITSYFVANPSGISNSNVNYVEPKQVDTYLDGVTPRRDLRVLTTYDATTGQPTIVDDMGAVGVTPSEERCTITSYDANNGTSTGTAVWLTNYPYQVATYAGPCGTGTLASLTQTTYDTVGNPLVTPPVIGNPVYVSYLTGTSATANTTSAFDSYGRVTSVKNFKDPATTTSYSPATGYPSTITTTDGAGDSTIQANFDWGRGLPTMTTDAGGNISHNFYDPLGRLIQVFTPDETVGLTAALTACPAKSYSYTVNNNGTTASEVSESQLESTGLTTLTCATAVGITSAQYVDGLGRALETQTEAPSGNRTVVRTVYDERGNVLVQSKPVAQPGAPGSGITSIALGSLTSYTVTTYDAINRVAAVDLYSDGALQWRQDSRVYLSDGYIDTPATTMGQTAPNSIRYQFDGHKQLDAVDENASLSSPTTFSSQTTRYQYSALGNLTKTTDPNGNVTTDSYDGLSRLTGSTDPDAGTWSYTYDNAGNLATSTDALNQTGAYSYDAADRQTGVYQTSTSGTQLASFVYNTSGASKGLLASDASMYGSTSYTRSYAYDDRDRLKMTTVTVPSGALAGTYADSVSYDKADHVTSETMPALGTGTGSLPAETVTTPYSSQGFPTTVTGTSPYVTATGYADNDLLTSRSYGGTAAAPVASRVYTYETNTQRLSTIGMTLGAPGAGLVVQADTYFYDNANNVLSISDAANSQKQCFSYDGQFRLSTALTTAPATACSSSAYSASGPAPYSTSLTYDALGNIATVRNNVTAVTSTDSYSNGHPEQVSAIGSTSFAYNADGATTGIGTVALAWDPQRRLSSVTSGTTVTTNIYDAEGNRIIATTPTTQTLYLSSGEITVTTATGVLTATRYYTEAGTLVAVRTPATISYIGQDGQDSNQISVDSVTHAVARHFYTPYGVTRSTTGTFTTTRGYLDKTLDPTTSLEDLGARFFYAAVGKFLNPDPLHTPGAAGGNLGQGPAPQADPQQSNAYSYAENNPTSLEDPTGLRIPDADAQCEHGDCANDSNSNAAAGQKLATSTPSTSSKPDFLDKALDFSRDQAAGQTSDYVYKKTVTKAASGSAGDAASGTASDLAGVAGRFIGPVVAGGVAAATGGNVQKVVTQSVVNSTIGAGTTAALDFGGGLLFEGGLASCAETAGAGCGFAVVGLAAISAADVAGSIVTFGADVWDAF